MEVVVQSQLPEGQPQGCFRLEVEEGQTVEWLLRLVCGKAGIPLTPSLCLRNSRDKMLEPHLTLNEAGVGNGNVLNWCDEELLQGDSLRMEVVVQSQLPEGQPQGCFRLEVEEGQTVEWLLRLVCGKAGIPLTPSLCLRNSRDKMLEPHLTLNEAGVGNGNVLNWCDEGVHIEMASGVCSIWWILCGISLVIGAVGLVAISVIKTQEDSVEFEYGIVFDAGSSHTSMYIYQWDGTKLNNSAVASQLGTECRAKGGGLSSYASNPEGVASGLETCLNQAKSSIPSSHQRDTPVYLGATAGMRLLRDVNSSVTDAILRVVRQTIQSFPFSLKNATKQVRIITGEEEGASGWVTSNYIAGAFQTGEVEPPPPQFGALDLGGASTQISFMPDSVLPAEYDFRVQLYGKNYSLYTHSYLCFGVNEVVRRLKAALVVSQNASTVDNPCGHVGETLVDTVESVFKAPCVSGSHALQTFGSALQQPSLDADDTNLTFHGTGNHSKCVDLVAGLFNFSAPCPYSQCSFGGVFQPNVTGKFYAFSSFFYIAKFLNLTQSGSFSLDQFSTSISVFCNKTWAEVIDIPADLPEGKPYYCMEATYVHTLLTRVYGFNEANWNRLSFVDKIRDTDIGWTLGFMISESASLPADSPPSTMSLVLFGLLVVLFAIFILVAVGFAVHARRHQIARQQQDYERLSSYGAI